LERGNAAHDIGFNRTLSVPKNIPIKQRHLNFEAREGLILEIPGSSSK
jgi:hypothetical protein